MQIILYSGQDCCLCDQAADMLQQLNDDTLVVEKVDVRNSSDLYHKYGARIPVLARADQRELGWPFDLQQLREFLA